MRVLHVDTGRQMRGGQWQVLHVLGGLREAGCEVELLAPAGSPLYGRAVAAGFAVTPYSPWRLARRAGAFDLVHAHDARSHTVAAAVTAKPLVVSRRVAFAVRPGLLSRWKYRRPAMLLAVSEFVAGRLREHGVEAARIRVVYDAVPLAPWFAGERSGLVAPATGDPMKGSALVAEAGVEVKFSSNLAEDLRSAEALVYLTHEEGLGSAILLAMMAGAAVVASGVGGIPELIEHERTGLLTGNEPSAIAAALRRLRDDPALRDAMAGRARQMVEQRFTIPVMTAGTISAYEEVLR
ncbi:MAG: glycosyltransferase family 4 protein [Acidobacteria bacterium]|nr:glycosyltransferase family 4 protein [Acidobacteriota bacterium]